MNKNSPPFSKLANVVTTLCVAFTVLGFSLYALKTGDYDVFHYFIPTIIPIVAVGMKFMATRLPWMQLGIFALTIIVVHFIIELLTQSFPPLFFIGDLVIPSICIFGFGRHWVSKGYIPLSSNRWPE